LRLEDFGITLPVERKPVFSDGRSTADKYECADLGFMLAGQQARRTQDKSQRISAAY